MSSSGPGGTDMNAKKDAVVYRGEKPCESLRQALAGAVAGETIVLRGDVTLWETLVLDKAVTLTTDGAPRTIRAEHSGAALKLTAAATVQGSGEDAALVIDGCGVERQDALVHLAGEGGFFRYVTVTGGNSGGCGGASGGAPSRAAAAPRSPVPSRERESPRRASAARASGSSRGCGSRRNAPPSRSAHARA